MTPNQAMRNTCFLKTLLLFPLLFVVNAQAASSFDGQFEEALRKEGLSGALWSTITPAYGIETGAIGIKNAATGERMMNATRTQTGSVTKVVLATGVLHLVTTGKLSLEADVAALLPQLAIDNPWAASDPIMVRHLLMHTAGLENFRLSQLFSQRASPTAPLAHDIMAHDGLLRVRTRPGRNYAYSNTGYILLAMVIEAVTRLPYERYMDQSILAPLGMRDSTFVFRTQHGADADPKLAMGHLDDLQPYPVTASFMRPVEQFATTAHDMGRFMQFLLSDGYVDGDVFVAPELLAALAPPKGTEAANHGLDTGHGLSLSVRDRNGVVGACHPGGTVGFRSMLCIFPEHAKGFFVAFNTDSETADYERFNRLLTERLSIPPESPVPTITNAIDLAPWRGIYVPTTSGIASLAWIDVVFNATHVGTAGDGLLLHAPGKSGHAQPSGTSPVPRRRPHASVTRPVHLGRRPPHVQQRHSQSPTDAADCIRRAVDQFIAGPGGLVVRAAGRRLAPDRERDTQASAAHDWQRALVAHCRSAAFPVRSIVHATWRPDDRQHPAGNSGSPDAIRHAGRHPAVVQASTTGTVNRRPSCAGSSTAAAAGPGLVGRAALRRLALSHQ